MVGRVGSYPAVCDGGKQLGAATLLHAATNTYILGPKQRATTASGSLNTQGIYCWLMSSLEMQPSHALSIVGWG